jgi:recombination protein RecT
MRQNTMNQVSTINNVYDVVNSQEITFNSTVSDPSITFKKEAQFACQLLEQSDYLSKAAWANQTSLIACVHNVASIGISLNPALKHAYLVPRKKAVCLDVSYRGLMHLAQSLGSILWVKAELVYSNDSFRSVGVDQPPEHLFNTFASEADRGNIVGGYCTAKLPNGDYLTNTMSIEEITKIAESSESYSSSYSPWKKWFGEMARKTLVKRGSKYWPTTDRLSAAIEYLNTEGGEGLAAISYPKRQQAAIEVIDGNPHETLYTMVKGQPREKIVNWLGVEKITDLTADQAQEFITSLRASQ